MRSQALYRLGDGCSILHGYAFSKMEESDDASLPIVVNIGNFQYTGGFRFESTRVQRYSGAYPERFRLAPGDVLLAMTCQTAGGEILGVPGRVPDDGAVYLHNQRLGKVVITKPDELDLGYLYYLFLSPALNAHLVATATGAKIQHTAPGRIEDFRWKRPPLPVQRRIADVLSAYDDLIENNARRIKILEEMARALYQEWFVEFRFPSHNGDKLVKSGDVQVPRGWRVARLGEVMELAYGKALKEGDRRPGEVKVYGSSGVVGCHDEALAQGPGIIVGRKGNVGAVHWSPKAFFPIDTVFFVRTELPLRYVFQNLWRQKFLNNDAAVPGLNRNQAYSLPFVIPPACLLAQYEQIAEDFLSQALLLEGASAQLAAARDLLLPRLISGEIELSP